MIDCFGNLKIITEIVGKGVRTSATSAHKKFDEQMLDRMGYYSGVRVFIVLYSKGLTRKPALL